MQFLVASPSAVSGTETARVHAGPLVAHDSHTRFLHRPEPNARTLWQEARSLVAPATGVLVLICTTLDKPYAKQIGLVTRHWSGKHHTVVQGINLLILLWSDGHKLLPVDYRPYDKATDKLTRNDHLRTSCRPLSNGALHLAAFCLTAGMPVWPISNRCGLWAGLGSHASNATA